MYYNWKERYQREGIEGLKDKRRVCSHSSEISNRDYLKLQKENEKLKKILADKELAIETLKEMLKKFKTHQRQGIIYDRETQIRKDCHHKEKILKRYRFS